MYRIKNDYSYALTNLKEREKVACKHSNDIHYVKYRTRKQENTHSQAARTHSRFNARTFDNELDHVLHYKIFSTFSLLIAKQKRKSYN